MEEQSASGPAARLSCKGIGLGAFKTAVAVVTLAIAAQQHPLAEALKLSSIREDGGHLGLGLLRTVEVVRDRYERAWTLVSAPEPTAENLDEALELLQANARQWESLEPAVKIWTERDSDESRGARSHNGASDSGAQRRTGADSDRESDSSSASSDVGNLNDSVASVLDNTSRIHDEAASLLAHNKAVLGQALARSGRMDEGITELESACPKILEHQQKSHSRRDSKSWLHCYANLVDLYKNQKRYDEVASVLARVPWLSHEDESQQFSKVAGDREAEAGAKHGRDADATSETGRGVSPPEGERDVTSFSESDIEAVDRNGTDDARWAEVAGDSSFSSEDSAGDDGGAEHSATASARTGKRSDGSSARGAGAARVAGLSKVASPGSSNADDARHGERATSRGEEATIRALLERHTEGMRASMNELVGELAVTTATRPTASPEWLESRVAAAEEVLAQVRAGLPTVKSLTDSGGVDGGEAGEVAPVTPGVPGHADVLREASHYLSAIKGVATQGWAYVDNELHRMERHPPPIAKPGFQSRREVVHTFRYLLMKARQYASENQGYAATATASRNGGRAGRTRGRKASATSKTGRTASSRGGTSTSTSRRDSHNSLPDTHGLLTLLIFAALAVLAAAVCTERTGKKHGRRRDVVRQRTATRAAKTVGSYVEPTHRSPAASAVVRYWAVLKSHGEDLRSVGQRHWRRAQAALAIASLRASANLRKCRSYGINVVLRIAKSGFKPCSVARCSVATGSVQSASGNGLQRQRSRKQVRNTGSVADGAAARSKAPVKTRAATATPPLSPESPPEKLLGVAVVVKDVAQEDALSEERRAAQVVEGPNKSDASSSPRSSKDAAVPRDEAEVKATQDAASSSSPALDAVADDLPALVDVHEGREAGATDLPFPEAMTAEQFRAIVEEDEKAWEQAREAEKTANNKTACGAAAVWHTDRSTVGQIQGVDKSSAPNVSSAGCAEDEGWSEVCSGGARLKGTRAISTRTAKRQSQVLSVRNVRAAAAAGQAPRSSSPGSDPATTTSASSSECGEGLKEFLEKDRCAGARSADWGNKRPTGDRNASNAAWPVPGRAARAAPTNRARRARRSPDRREGSRRNEFGAVQRQPAQQRTSQVQRNSVLAPWSSQSATDGRSSVGSHADTDSSVAWSSARWNKASDERRARDANEGVQRAGPGRQPQPKLLQVGSLRNEGRGDRRAEGENGDGALPTAWTDRKPHPLASARESLPPASLPPVPPPNHQQHWQRQQQKEEQRRKLQEELQQRQHEHEHGQMLHQQQEQQPLDHHSHVQHRQPPQVYPPHHGPHPAPMVGPVPLSSGAPHGIQPLPPPPQPPQPQAARPPHHHLPHDVPHFIPPAEEMFPAPPALHISTSGSMMYPPLPMHVSAASPAVSPGGGGMTGPYDSPLSANVGGSFSAVDVATGPPVPQLVPMSSEHDGPQVFSNADVIPSDDGGGHGDGVLTMGYHIDFVPPQHVEAGFMSGQREGDGTALEALMGTLCWQVEYYFSVENLTTDVYLRNLMDTQGFVPIAKIMVFNRVRNMTSDMGLLVDALRRSTELELREEGHEGVCVRTRHNPERWVGQGVDLGKQEVMPKTPQVLAEDQRQE